MESTIPVEQRLIKVIRILASDKQQVVLDYAEVLQHSQSKENAGPSQTDPIQLCSEKENNTDSDETISLAKHGIGVEQAAKLRHQLQTFSVGWNRPEMAIYDEL